MQRWWNCTGITGSARASKNVRRAAATEKTENLPAVYRQGKQDYQTIRIQSTQVQNSDKYMKLLGHILEI